MYYNYYYIVNNFNPDSYIDKNISDENMIISEQQLDAEPPTSEVPPSTIPPAETGTLSVKVLTESGQPVKDALITVFHFHQNGKLEVHYNIRTDENGSIPEMVLPVRHSEVVKDKVYYYSTYNLRVIADNYLPVNIVNFQVFPKIKTNYIVRLIPITAGGTENVPEKTIVIPIRQ